MYLKGRKILYITTDFFEYPQEICNTINKYGGNVDLFYIHKKNILYTILRNVNYEIYKKRRANEEYKILNKIAGKVYDIILIQHTIYISKVFLNTLKNMFPKSIFINYNWDSLNSYNYLEYINYFDKVFSFDYFDCKKHNLLYLPLFYTNHFKPNNNNNDYRRYDVSFIGIIGNSVRRYEFVQEIISQCIKKKLSYYYYLYIDKNYYIKSIIKGKYYTNIKFKKLTLSDVAYIYKQSRAIVDYHNPNQSGLTMRTFEVLGSGRKLITTNGNITIEPFYDDNNIQVINPHSFELNDTFIKDTTYNIPSIIKNYNIDNWIKELLRY